MLIFTLLFLLLGSPTDIQAEEKRKILILYDLEDDEDKDQVYIADLLVGHFTDDIKTLDVKKMDKVELDEFTHLIYLHMNNHKPTETLISAINEYEENVLYIDHIVKYLILVLFSIFKTMKQSVI